jgi:hypothetical protein
MLRKVCKLPKDYTEEEDHVIPHRRSGLGVDPSGL